MRTWICADAKLVRVLKLNTLALNFTALNAVLSKSSCGSWLPPACKCLVVNCVSAVERGALSLPNECRYQTAARPVTHILGASSRGQELGQCGIVLLLQSLSARTDNTVAPVKAQRSNQWQTTQGPCLRTRSTRSRC